MFESAYSNSSFRLLQLSTRLSAVLCGALLCVFPIGLCAQGVSFGGPNPSVNFGTANLCASGQTTPAPCSATMTLSYNVTGSGTLGTPKVLTLGAPDLDFTLASGSTCTGSVTEGNSCTVNVKFAPFHPGERNGAVEIVDGDGKVLANTYIYGTGIGPAIVFSPSVQTILGDGLSTPYAVAVDGSGNVYVAEIGTVNFAVYEVPAGCGSSSCVTPLGGGFNAPAGITVDGSGNVFVADEGNSAVKEMPPGCASSSCVTTLGGGFHGPRGMVVDGHGNVYVGDLIDGINAVYEMPPGCASSSCVTKLVGGLGENSPFGMAVDGSGNVYFADNTNSVVKKIPPGCASSSCVTTVGGSLPGVGAVAVDGSGNVYAQGNAVTEMPPGCTSSSCVTTLLDGGFSPAGVAVDGSGNVFTADYAAGQIVELPRSQPPALSFASTPVGATSSPQAVTVQNIGNAALNFTGLTVSDNFLQVAGSGTPEDCSSSLSLAPGAECNLSLSFMPTQTGPLTGTTTLTDNALNAPAPNYATQTISLSGTGTSSGSPLAQVSATTLNYPNIAFPGTETMPLTITNIGGGTLTVSPAINGPSYTITASTCGSEVTAGNSCVLTVQFEPVRVGLHHDTLTLQNNGLTTPTVLLTGTGTGVGPETEAPLNFGTIPFGTTTVLPLTITNVGVAGTVTVSTSVSSDPSFTVLTNAQNTCLAGISSGQSCVLPVEFAPAWVGVHSNHVTVTPSGGGAVTNVPLYGVASAASFGPISVPGTSVVFDPDNVLTAAQLTVLGSNGPLGATPAVQALAFPAAPGQVMTFSASGLVGSDSIANVGPDGCPPNASNLPGCNPSVANVTSLGSISGYQGIGFALMGVFTNGNPEGAAPADYDYSVGFGQLTYAPLLNQVFFIGDGLTGTGTGSTQMFQVPSSATQLWLGFVDAFDFTGSPAAYGDNPGSLSVSGTLKL